jgi:hypothetical protein
VPLCAVWTENITKIQSISFINKGNTQQKVKIENNDQIVFTTQLYRYSMKRHFLQIFYFACFATFIVQNLPARERKTEKNKEMA